MANAYRCIIIAIKLIMKTAILYLRVNTDEQALRGYSLRAQQEMLTNYCKLHGISILKIFTEDHSAKSA